MRVSVETEIEQLQQSAERDLLVEDILDRVRVSLGMPIEQLFNMLRSEELEACSEITGKGNVAHKHESLSKIVYGRDILTLKRREKTHASLTSLMGNVMKLVASRRFANDRGEVQWSGGRSSFNMLLMELIKNKASIAVPTAIAASAVSYADVVLPPYVR